MNRKIKVLLIAEAMLGGVRKHILDIIYALDKDKYALYLAYSAYRADRVFFENYENIEKFATLIRCKYMYREINIVKDVKAICELKKIIQNIQPDIIHCHSSKAGIIGRVAGKLCNIKYIYYSPHAYAFQNSNLGFLKYNIYLIAEQFLTKYMTTKTINVSQGELNAAIKNHLGKRDKFVLIYNGVSKMQFINRKNIREQYGFSDEQILVGVTARITRQKDPLAFLAIAQSVIKQDDRVHFIYIGDGDMEEAVKLWINERNLENKIHLLGFQNDADKMVYMFDIYLSTSLYEGLPYSVLEALSAGIPVVATDVAGNNELITNGKNGMLFPKGDINSGINCVMDQIKTGRIDEKVVLETTRQKFSIENMINKIDDLYCFSDK